MPGIFDNPEINFPPMEGQGELGAGETPEDTGLQSEQPTGQEGEQSQLAPEGEKPEGQADNTDGEKPETDKLFAGKFKNENDLEKGYLNLLAELNKRGIELPDMDNVQSMEDAYKELEVAFTKGTQLLRNQGQQNQPNQGQQMPQQGFESTQNLQAPQGQANADNFDWNGFNQKFLTDLKSNPAKAITDLVNDIASQIVDSRVRPMEVRNQSTEFENGLKQQLADLKGKNPDFMQHAKTMLDMLPNYPGIEFFPNGINLLYQAAKAQNAASFVAQAREMGRQEKADEISEKMGAVITSGSAKTQQKALSPEQQFQKDFINGIMAARPKGIFGS
jgi:hypothetical protein